MKEYDNWEKKFFKCPNTANSIDVKENEEAKKLCSIIIFDK